MHAVSPCRRNGRFLVSTAAMAIGSIAHAQGGLPVTVAPTAAYGFGNAIASGGDLDHDGQEDFIVFDPEKLGTNGWVSTVVSAYSGRAGALLWSIERVVGPDEGTVNGRSNGAIVGDLNEDGTDDVVVGFPNAKIGDVTDAGRLEIRSGVDGALLRAINGSATNQRLGRDVIGLGDTNLDGVPDYAVVASNALAGEVWICSGTDDSVLVRLPQNQPRRLANAGDFDSDGVCDLVIGSDRPTQTSAWLVSGRDGHVLREFAPPIGEVFGYIVAAGAELSGDGVTDFVFGDGGFGRIYVYSGANGALIQRITRPLDGCNGSLDFGVAIVLCDVNQDGISEILSTDGCTVFAFDARTGLVVRRYHYSDLGYEWDYRPGGEEVASGDLSGDGWTDVLIGSPQSNLVFAHASSSLGLGIDGAIKLATVQRGNVLELTIDNGTPNGTVRLFASQAGKDCTLIHQLGLCVDLSRPFEQVGTLATDATGAAALSLPIPARLAPGLVWFQCFERDDSTRAIAKSNVLEITVIR